MISKSVPPLEKVYDLRIPFLVNPNVDLLLYNLAFVEFLIILPLSVFILFACVGIHWLIIKYIPFALGKVTEK